MTLLTVFTDSRVRTLSAILAATDWPEREQQPLPRGVHPQAAALKKHVGALRDRPSVAAAAAYVQATLNAEPRLAPLFARALSDDPELSFLFQAFTAATALDVYWVEHEAPWAQAVLEVRRQVSGIKFAEFLTELFDAVPDELVILPNLAYPTTHSFGIRTPTKLYSIMPPRKAVGESPPWPFGDDRDYVVRLALHDFVQAQLHDLLNRRPELIPAGQNHHRLPGDFRAAFPSWETQVVELFAYAAQIIFLNRLEDGAGDSFSVYERRTRQLGLLPAVVHELTNYIAGRGVAQPYAEIETYFPHFTHEVDRLLFESAA